MKITRLPLPEILQILSLVSVEIDEEEDVDTELVGGVYARDSQGQIWKRDAVLTGLVDNLQPDGPPMLKVRVVK